MATTSRIYKLTDWQVWTYKPVAGKFRLDFSALNGSDVLGAVGDVGGMAVLDLPISGITIEDGGEVSQSVFGQVVPASASISASLNSWNASFVKELYPGKPLTITLKNQSVVDIDVYGRNSVFFMGNISDSSYDVDPIASVTTFTINAQDIITNALNQQMQVNKNVGTKNASFNLSYLDNEALFDNHLTVQGNTTPYLSYYEFGGLETKSLGEWVDDHIATYVSIPTNYWEVFSGALKRYMILEGMHDTPTSGVQVTDSVVTNVIMATDGANKPTSFNLSNSTVSYINGQTDTSILTQANQYSATIDVTDAVELSRVATEIGLYKPALSPTSITIKTATPNQTIVFDNNKPGNDSQYYYPNNFYHNGTDLDVYLAYFAQGGTTPHYYTRIIGQSHEITPDSWNTTYTLLKGV